MSGLLSISGLISGLDTDKLIEKIMEFESQGVTRIEQRITAQKTVLTGFNAFEATLLGLQVEFNRLSSAINFKGKTVTSSDEEVFTASAGTTAAPGTFTLTIDQLAQSHQVVSQGFTSRTSEIGTGTFSFTVGNRTQVDITIDEGNNTVEGLADAINAAKAGATASIVNTGDAETPFLLLITGEGTGSAQRIVIDASLSGGAAPEFGSVGPVVEGGKSGTSTVSSSGNYTGDASGTLSFTVESGGTIGVDNIEVSYTDGDGVNGSFTIASDYVPGEEIDVYGGVKLAFSAGTLDTNDSFSTDVTAGTIQAPLDARFTMGNSLGGASGITLTSASNTVTDIIEGVTFKLHRASDDPVTITIDHDTDGVRDDIRAMVDKYNAFVDLMDELFYFDLDADERGALLGDRSTIDMYGQIQNMITNTAQGVTGVFRSLGDVGITVSGEGKLVVNDTRLDQALFRDIDSVMQLFAAWGRTTDSDIRFLGAADETVAYSVTSAFQNGYQIEITQAAEKAVLAGSQIANPSQSGPIVIDSANAGLRIKFGNKSTGDLRLREGVYESGEELAAEIQAKIEASDEIASGAVVVSYVDDGGGQGHLEFSSGGYGSSQTIEIEAISNSVYGTIGHTEGSDAEGKDVEGTINGEAAKGVGQILTGETGNLHTDGLKLLVTLSPEQLAAQGGDQGSVTVTKGIGATMRDSILRMTDTEDGQTTIRKETINDQIAIFEKQVENMEERLEIRRERIVEEFNQLESALAELQNQQEYLTQALAALSATRG